MVFANYSVFRAFAIFAGVFGIFQSLIWIGFAITGIVAYYCDLDLTGQTDRLGSLLTLTFFHQYFEGTCTMTNIPVVDMTAVRELNLLSPGDLHAWVWVYLILHIFWAISSLILLTNARKKYIRYVNVFLFVWIAFTVTISVLDLALGIQFGVDYDTIIHALFLRIAQPTVTQADHVLALASTVSGIMMVMAFRGWIFWVVNVGLAVYLFTQTFKIYDYNQLRRKSAGMANGGFVGDQGARRGHIDAYDSSADQEDYRRPYNGPPVTNYRRPLDRISEQPREIIERPIQHHHQQPDWRSNSPQYQQQQRPYTPQQQPQQLPPPPQQNYLATRTFEPLAREQSFTEPEPEIVRPDPPKPIPPPPPPKNFNAMNTVVRRDAAAAKVAQELNYRNSINAGGPSGNGLRTFGLPASSNAGDAGELPMPNYSPPMPRVNPFENRPPLRSVLRNSRYQ
uniref:Putative conserved plasma membrane protein n=1 Tax=Culex tarsalis TaxID=7177 RepID=A0A1Q3FQW2_CULTA